MLHLVLAPSVLYTGENPVMICTFKMNGLQMLDVVL